MMRFLVFQHVAVEDPGSFCDFWREDGIAWDTVELDAGEPIPAALERYDALVVMGGPMDVWQEDRHPWLTGEKQAIRRFVAELRRPFLGICLGHQLLAEAVGGAVGLAAQPEVGLSRVDLTSAGRQDPLFADFPDGFPTFQWHGAEVARLPADGVALAGNAACAVQAFRWGAHAYGLQYHPEITAQAILDWQKIDEYRAYLDAVLGPEGAARLAVETRAALPGLTAAAQRVHCNFCRLIAAQLTAADPGA